MIRLRLPGLPRDPLVELDAPGRSGLITRPWISWLRAVVSQVDGAPYQLQAVRLSDQTWGVPTTAVPLPGIPAALYRVSFTVRVTRAASTSSSLTVTVTWKDGGVTCSQSWAAVTGNTTATVQTGTALLRVDADGPISYGVVYGSVGATSMQYALSLVVELLPGATS